MICHLALVAGLALVPPSAGFGAPGHARAPPTYRRALHPRMATAERTSITAPTLSADQLLDRHPSGELEVCDVIDTMMACVHRDNADSQARPYLGCEVALRFLSSSHQASGLMQSGGPPAFRRYLLQPHKQALATWGEYRATGEPIITARHTRTSSRS